MCGRYALVGPVSRKNRREIEDWLDEVYGFPPRYNAAPTQMLPIIRVGGDGKRETKALRWGLIPSWAKDAAIGAKLINARGDTVAAKPSFRAAFKRRRCLVPMSGFYEWQALPTGKLPYFIRVLNTDLFAAAGLYEWWGGAGGEPVESFTIITTDGNELMKPLYNRMPVILSPEDYTAWLDPDNQSQSDLQALLRPYPADEMEAYPVSTRVNNVRNDGADLIAPVGQAWQTGQ